MSSEIDEILGYWFGELDADGRASPEKKKIWWGKGDALDNEIRGRFERVYDAVVGGERDEWLAAPRSTLAYVIVLDQFSRNMFRDTPKMYAADDRARDAVRAALAAGRDRELACAERTFLYMPLMHSESIEDQDRCCALFSAMAEDTNPAVREAGADYLKFAIQHRDIVARFARFPHRNAILGRESTPEESAFLTEPGSSF